MPAKIKKSFIDVGNCLGRLGTSRNLLMEVVDAVVAARSECTANDPSGARGWRGWQMGTRRAREVHSPQEDWEKDETDQVPSIVNEKLGIRIVVCNTDDGTCIEGRSPKNRSKKGPDTDRAIEDNRQMLLFSADETPVSVVQFKRKTPGAPALNTYYLCIYHEGDDIRAELSCAILAEGGFFADFTERLFIFGGDTGPDPLVKRKNDDDDGSSGFDIPVNRKK